MLPQEPAAMNDSSHTTLMDYKCTNTTLVTHASDCPGLPAFRITAANSIYIVLREPLILTTPEARNSIKLSLCLKSRHEDVRRKGGEIRVSFASKLDGYSRSGYFTPVSAETQQMWACLRNHPKPILCATWILWVPIKRWETLGVVVT